MYTRCVQAKKNNIKRILKICVYLNLNKSLEFILKTWLFSHDFHWKEKIFLIYSMLYKYKVYTKYKNVMKEFLNNLSMYDKEYTD